MDTTCPLKVTCNYGCNALQSCILELNSLSQSKLMALSTEMENLIQAYNADLVTALAQRDEMEYEKEVKNKFITLLLDIQDQRRKFTGDKKRRSFRAKESKMPQVRASGISLVWIWLL